MPRFQVPKIKSRFVTENKAESLLEQLAKEETTIGKQGLGLLLNNFKYGALSAGIGALLGYAITGDNISSNEGIKQSLIAGLPNYCINKYLFVFLL